MVAPFPDSRDPSTTFYRESEGDDPAPGGELTPAWWSLRAMACRDHGRLAAETLCLHAGHRKERRQLGPGQQANLVDHLVGAPWRKARDQSPEGQAESVSNRRPS